MTRVLATWAHSRMMRSSATLVLSLDGRSRVFLRWQLRRHVVLGKNYRYASDVAPVVDRDYASLVGPYADSVVPVPHPHSLGSSAVGFSGPHESRYRNHRQSHRACLWPQ